MNLVKSGKIIFLEDIIILYKYLSEGKAVNQNVWLFFKELNEFRQNDNNV